MMRLIKKLTLITVLAFLYSCNNTPVVKVIDRWENGKNKIVFTYSNSSDTLSYLRESFYANGKRENRGIYKNGLKDGLWEWWFENGNKKDEATFKLDMYVGERKHWRLDSTLKKIELIDGACKEDCCNGKVLFYDNSGVKYGDYSIRNGVWDGVAITYYTSGRKKNEFHYKNGKKEGEAIEYDEQERILALGSYTNDKSNGIWVTKDTMGKLVGKFVEKDDLRNGLDSEFYSNGMLRTTGRFIDDKEEGKWIFYDTLGQIEGWHLYNKGELIKQSSSKGRQ